MPLSHYLSSSTRVHNWQDLRRYLHDRRLTLLEIVPVTWLLMVERDKWVENLLRTSRNLTNVVVGVGTHLAFKNGRFLLHSLCFECLRLQGRRFFCHYLLHLLKQDNNKICWEFIIKWGMGRGWSAFAVTKTNPYKQKFWREKITGSVSFCTLTPDFFTRNQYHMDSKFNKWLRIRTRIRTEKLDPDPHQS
jgi:hypothetical protein